MKDAIKESDIEQTDQVMDDIADYMEMNDEINDVFARSIVDFDEDELNEELMELEELEADSLINDLRVAPQSKLNQKKVTDDVPDVITGILGLFYLFVHSRFVCM